MEFTVHSEEEMSLLGVRIGSLLEGGETIQLIGDVGAGKTTFTKFIAKGMGITDTINSPSYTISIRYKAPNGLHLMHYDFYRLSDPGIMANEIGESIADSNAVSVIEWGDIVRDILPKDSLRVTITPFGETERRVVIIAGGDKSGRVLKELQ